jgi:hypothetical protein
VSLQEKMQIDPAGPDRERSGDGTAPDQPRPESRTVRTAPHRRRRRSRLRCIAFHLSGGVRCRGVALSGPMPLCRRHARNGWLRLCVRDLGLDVRLR